MQEVLLVIHLMLAIAIVITVLLQRSEGGALGMGGGGGGVGGGLMTGREAANLLARSTAFLAACFFATSLTLPILAGNSGERRSILEQSKSGGAPNQSSSPAGPTVPTNK